MNCSVSDLTFDSQEQAFLNLINNYRAQNGAGPLTVSVNLNRAASWMAKDLADNNYFSHTDSLGRSPSERVQDCDFPGGAGENIAGGTSLDTAQEAFDLWRTSPGHDANMRNGSYVQIGIARYYNAASTYKWYWVTDFSLVDDGTRLSAPGGSPTATPPTPTPAPPSTPPAAPSWAGATPLSTSQIRLDWNDNSNNEQGFTIYRHNGGTSWVLAGSVGANVRTFTDGGLAAGTPRMYVVYAWNTAGQTMTPGAITTATLSSAPQAPVLSSATGTSTSQVRLDWVDNSDNEQGFKIFRFNGSAWAQIATVGANVATFTDSGLSAGQQYAYWLWSYNSNGNGYSPSTVYAFTYPNGADPQAPRFVSAAPVSGNQIRLTWTDNTSDEQGFVVYRRISGNWTFVGGVGPNVTTFVDSGLTPGGNELYYVFAHNQTYFKSSPSPLNAETLPVLPESPNLTSAIPISSTQIRINWQDNSNNESGFKIFRWNGSVWLEVAAVGANSTTFTDSGLNAGTFYAYWVWSYSASAEGYAPVSLWATTLGP